MTGSKKMSWEQAVMWLKEQRGSQELVRSCFYDDPLIEAAERYYRSTEWRAVQSLVGAPRGRALDLGSGRGISAFALARDGWNAVALEPDGSKEVGAGAIRRLAKEGAVNIEVVEEWGESLPFESNSFELVHCRQVLHHARDLRQLCREVGRVLKPGGMVIATREHVLSRREDLPVFLKNHPLHYLYGGENAYLLSDYKGALEDAGLRLTSILNSLQSDINTFPETRESVRNRFARKLRLPYAKMIPLFVLSWRGKLINTPGRSYTFVGLKENS
jgi:SAM-dependent methyltransferase